MLAAAALGALGAQLKQLQAAKQDWFVGASLVDEQDISLEADGCCDQVTPAASSQQPAASSNQAQQPAGASACTCAACTALKGAHPSSLSHQI